LIVGIILAWPETSVNRFPAPMQTNGIPPIVIDARGLLCPEPLVRTRLALRLAAAGAIVEIQATDPLAALDIEVLCARGGAVYLGCTSDAEGLHTIRIVKP